MAYLRPTYVVLFVCCLQYLAAEMNKGTSFQHDTCLNMLEDFLSSMTAFKNCEDRATIHDGQINFCRSCISSYMNVTEVYNNITKLESPEHRTCAKILADIDDFLQDIREAIQSSWKNAECDNDACLTMLNDFGNSIDVFKDCENRAPLHYGLIHFCQSCASSYSNVTEVYNNMTKLEIPESTTCDNELADIGIFRQYIKEYESIQRSWENAKCDSEYLYSILQEPNFRYGRGGVKKRNIRLGRRDIEDDTCQNVLNEFGDSIAAFKECKKRTSHHRGDKNLCLSCSTPYLKVIEVYNNMSKLESLDHKTCDRELADVTDYLQDIQEYESIQSSWKNAECDNNTCLNILEDFGKSIAVFKDCKNNHTQEHGNIEICLSCATLYLDVTEVYNNITKLESSDHKTCDSELAEVTDYLQDMKEYKSIQKFWKNAECDNNTCLNILEDFGKSITVFKDCKNNHTQEHGNIDICLSCGTLYLNVTEVYNNITKLESSDHKTCDTELADVTDYLQNIKEYKAIQKFWKNAECDNNTCLNILEDFGKSIAVFKDCKNNHTQEHGNIEICLSCATLYLDVTEVYNNITKLESSDHKTCDSELADVTDYLQDMKEYKAIQKFWKNAECDNNTCLNILEDFGKSIAVFKDCKNNHTQEHGNIDICFSCATLYLDVTEVYNNITKLESPDHKTCDTELADVTDYLQNMKEYKAIQKYWKNAECDNNTCLNILEDFGKSIAVFKDCKNNHTQEHGNIEICLSCATLYLDVTEVYNNITKLESSDHKTCDSELAEVTDYLQDMKEYKSIQKFWKNAECDNNTCLNILEDFGKSIAVFKDCKNNHTQEHGNIEICLSCATLYLDVTEVYNNITKLESSDHKTCDTELADVTDYLQNIKEYKAIQKFWKNAECDNNTCLNILEDFGKSIAVFKLCKNNHTQEHGNIEICLSCATLYLDVTEVYNNIKKLESSDHKTCDSELAEVTDYLQDMKEYKSIQKFWKNAECDNNTCLNILEDFGKSITVFKDCRNNHTQEHGNIDICLSCATPYLNVIEVYNNITKLESRDHKTCESELANVTNYLQDIQEYKSIQKFWKTAECDNNTCLNMLEDFRNTIEAFENCESRSHNLCLSCASSYSKVTEVHSNITKLETSEHQTCGSELSNVTDYVHDIEKYESVQSSWKNAKCPNDSCLHMWRNFENSIVAFENCESHATLPGPINFCLQCVSSYLNITECYNDIKMLETCASAMDNIDDFLQDFKEYGSIQSLWQKEKCDNCYVKNKDNEIIDQQTDLVKEIENATSVYGACVYEYRNATAKQDLVVCDKCLNAYERFNDIYTKNEEWCADVSNKISLMRNQWHDELGCSESQNNSKWGVSAEVITFSVVGIAILLIVSSLMIYFYIKKKMDAVIESDARPLIRSEDSAVISQE